MENNKSHYFIGNIFSNEEQIKKLRHIQKKLRKKYKLKEYHSNNLFFTNMVYLGFFDSVTATLYMNEIISYLLTSIQNNFTPFECTYGRYKMHYDKIYHRISLTFDDKDSYINNIIVPYLYENAIFPIFEKRKNIPYPEIDLLFYKTSTILDKKTKFYLVSKPVPPEKFIIDNISLIKGTPLKKRIGTPSIHDEMRFELVTEYKYDMMKQ
jgi:hypothetical protein